MAIPGMGTLINAAGVVAGGLLGLTVGRFIKEKYQNAVVQVCGLGTMCLGIAGVMEGMLSVEDGRIVSGRGLFVILCLAVGVLIGEWIDLEAKFERFGEWLKKKSGNAKDEKFVDGFVITSLTICIGAMAILGAIQDGVLGDYSLLATKAVIDFVFVMVMTASLGIGCMFSAIPVLVYQGAVTALATLLRPVMTEAALANLSMVGSVLIFCVASNLVFGKRFKVANLLPAIVVAVAAAFLPV